MNIRQELKSDRLLLRGISDDKPFTRTFTVVGLIDNPKGGASCICYKAHHDGSGIGVLKEFYPQDAYGLERNEQGQLIPSSDFEAALNSFKEAENEYIRPYMELLSSMQQNAELSTFIPSFEIYKGCDEQGKPIGTTYIFMPEPEKTTFDKICNDIHENSETDPEHKLVTTLSAIESLAKGICTIHSAGLLHLDIKPSNFGFIKRSDEILTQTLSLFDIDSIRSICSSNKYIKTTDEYAEPEIVNGPSNKSDIYAIGATLFNAVIITDETEAGDYFYKREYYDRLSYMVEESKLIQACDAHPMLKGLLTKILQKCLAPRKERYERCEDLIGDLTEALKYALPSEISSKMTDEKWILAKSKKLDKYLDRHKNKDSLLKIQYHLYEYPLYEHSLNNELNILVIGLENYGQSFLDAALQLGSQLMGKSLTVTVIASDKAKENYLLKRPELKNFYNIDGQKSSNNGSYGKILFKVPGDNAYVENRIIGEQHYIFVALDGDDLNYETALACKAVNENCTVSFACEKQSYLAKSRDKGIYPVYVYVDVKKSTLHSEIERMAFNVHLVWQKELNIDFDTVRADFVKNRYNHHSSVSNAISIKYKLHNLGINLDDGFEQAAMQVWQQLSDERNRANIDTLICLEHRSWVIEKLCLGWRAKDVGDCTAGVTKDEKNRQHVCIRTSTPSRTLEQWSHEKWDAATKDDIENLGDELDKMSVRLHQIYLHNAQAVLSDNILFGNEISSIREMISESKPALTAFDEWFNCLTNIWNRDKSKPHLMYRGLKGSFEKAVKGLSREADILAKINAFDVQFFPIMASTVYRDWKLDDVALIENIPFVLTYNTNNHLVIPFATGSNSHVFQNVASASIVAPAQITYMVLVENEDDIVNLLSAVNKTLSFMSKKKYRSEVSFILLRHSKLHNCNIKIGEGYTVKELEFDKMEKIPEMLKKTFIKRAKGRLFMEKNDTALSKTLEMAGFYNFVPCYRFSSKCCTFDTCGCEMLNYINKKPSFTVSELIALSGGSVKIHRQPEFFDSYKWLYEKFLQRPNTWKVLCSLLEEYHEQADVLAELKIREKRINVKKEYPIPLYCKNAVQKILTELTRMNIIEEGSGVFANTSSSCRVVINDRYGNGKEYDKLFSNANYLAFSWEDSVSVRRGKSNVKVIHNGNLSVTVDIPSDEKEIFELLDFFAQKQLITDLSVDEKTTFYYSTREIKELLTTAGQILEIFVYHKLKESGNNFSDIINGAEVFWEDEGVYNEIDIAVSLGFDMILIECKATNQILQEYVFKLSSLNKLFGINSKAVLISNSSSYNKLNNDMQKSRGDKLGIITVDEKEQIKNISDTILSIFKGTYNKEDK